MTTYTNLWLTMLKAKEDTKSAKIIKCFSTWNFDHTGVQYVLSGIQWHKWYTTSEIEHNYNGQY